MVTIYGFFFAILLVGGSASPLDDDAMSIFFDHTVRDAEGRIVGGQVAREGAAPWAVALTNGAPVRGLFCGGSLVSLNAIITAAHCIRAVVVGHGLSPSLRATVGTNRWNSGGQLLTLRHFVMHPHYSPYTVKNDIGVLRTSRNVQLNNRVMPVGLTWDWIPGGVPSRVHGWGRTSTGGPISTQLLELSMNTFDAQRCVVDVARISQHLQIPVTFVDPHLEICTFHSTNRGTCNGDSGMALVRAWDKRQIGVVTWGLPCARGAPDVYARMSIYRSFIENAMR